MFLWTFLGHRRHCFVVLQSMYSVSELVYVRVGLGEFVTQTFDSRDHLIVFLEQGCLLLWLVRKQLLLLVSLLLGLDFLQFIFKHLVRYLKFLYFRRKLCKIISHLCYYLLISLSIFVFMTGSQLVLEFLYLFLQFDFKLSLLLYLFSKSLDFFSKEIDIINQINFLLVELVVSPFEVLHFRGEFVYFLLKFDFELAPLKSLRIMLFLHRVYFEFDRTAFDVLFFRLFLFLAHSVLLLFKRLLYFLICLIRFFYSPVFLLDRLNLLFKLTGNTIKLCFQCLIDCLQFIIFFCTFL